MLKIINTKYCFLFLFVLSLNSYLAQYKKIPIDSNYFWKQSSVSDPNFSNCNYNYQIKYKKDTIIGSKTYNKYSTFGAASGNTVYPCNPDFIRNGYLRQDTLSKLVFILDNNFIERPLYNFNKVVGDTMLVYQRNLNANITVTVTIYDSTQFLDGSYHKFQFVKNSTTYGNYFYEGMGAVNGGLYGHNTVGYIPHSEQIRCFGKINTFTPIYTTSQTTCTLSGTVGIKDYEANDSGIKISPNPTSGKVSIQYEDFGATEVNISITNVLGQKVYSVNNINKNEEIDLSFLSNGVYYIILTNNSAFNSAKIIKE